MSERFTETLKRESEPLWAQAVEHRFVGELFAGSVADEVMALYLVQDHRFLDSFLILLGAAIAASDSFDALGVSAEQRAAIADTKPTAGFKAIMREAAASGSYAATLAVLNVAEWLYLDWAIRAPVTLPQNFIHAEWITLHDNPDFRDFVGFLRRELDRAGPGEAEVSRDFFRRAVALELAFFDAAYERGE